MVEYPTWLRSLLGPPNPSPQAPAAPYVANPSGAIANVNPYLTASSQPDSFVPSDSANANANHTQYNLQRMAEQVKRRSDVFNNSQAALAANPDDPTVRTAYEIAQNAFTNLNNILIDMIKFMREINNAWNNL
jgi:hypothetical protein